MAKPKILFIGDYCRTDYLGMLDKATDACNFWFLYFASSSEEQNKSYLNYGKAVYWSDYKSAQAILEALAPQKVLFLYLDTYHAVVLNIACKNIGIPTYHLEHGMRADYDITLPANTATRPLSKLSSLRDTLYSFGDRVKARLFLKNSIRNFSGEDAAFVKEYIALRSKSSFQETFQGLPSAKRIADKYISFSPKVYQVHQQYDHLPADQVVYFIGIPYFDKLANTKPAAKKRAILFIDQPLAEKGLLQWTSTYKAVFIQKLTGIAALHNYKLYVKPHPYQDISLWGKEPHVKLVNDEQLSEIGVSIPIVIGFYSTYLMPFAAFNHTTLITLECHPAGRLDVSKPFVDAGVAHPVYSLKDLSEALERIELLHQRQLPHKKQFEQEWLYKFDGKAGDRLRAILLSQEL